MNSSLLSTQTGHSHLRRLFMLRNWAILAQFATLILVHRFLSTDFAWTPMIGTVVFLVLVNLLTWWRLSLDYPVGNLELFLQLCLDVNALTVLLYFGGGSTNPFVSLYLLPLVLAAATLPRRYTWGMAALTVACYSLLMVWYVPLPTGDAHAGHTGHTTTTVIAASAVTATPVHDHTAMTMDHSQHQMHELETTPTDYCRTEPESAPANATADTSPLLVQTLHEIDPATRIVMLTGYASIATAVEAIKLGATQYLSKPANADEIVAAFGHHASTDIPLDAHPVTVDRLEWEHINRVLHEQQGNISSTARVLNMHRRTLQRKLAKRPY